MSENTFDYARILALAMTLTPTEKTRLIEEMSAAIREEINGQPRRPRPSLYGILKGVSVSEEDIDEIRREMWKNFPREDI
jgi:hypothetical protein